MPAKHLHLILGFSCNSNCVCCTKTRYSHLGDIGTARAKELLLSGVKNGCTDVVFTGGEPTIRADLGELVLHAKQIGFKRVHVQTNGRMLSYPDFCKKLVDAGVDRFLVSIHGPSPDVHDAISRAPGSFEQAVRGIKNLKKLGQRVAVNSLICKPNYRFIPESAKLFVDLGVDSLQFSFIHSKGNAEKNVELLLPRMSSVKEFVHKGVSISLKAGIKTMVEAYPFCFMEGYESCCSERFKPSIELRSPVSLTENFNEVRKKWGRVKGEKCRACKYFNVCEGPWREYVELFGWSEFKPVKGKRIESVEGLFAGNN